MTTGCLCFVFVSTVLFLAPFRTVTVLVKVSLLNKHNLSSTEDEWAPPA